MYLYTCTTNIHMCALNILLHIIPPVAIIITSTLQRTHSTRQQHCHADTCMDPVDPVKFESYSIKDI